MTSPQLRELKKYLATVLAALPDPDVRAAAMDEVNTWTLRALARHAKPKPAKPPKK